MPDSSFGFAMGRFFFRFLRPSEEPLPPEGRCLVDPCWDVDDPPLRYRNLADRVAAQLTIDLNGAPLASWLLARLWLLSAGAIEQALNVQSGVGFADGGHYLAYAVVENASQQGMAELIIEAMPRYLRISIDYRSQQIDPEEILENLATTLLAEPSQLAICRIQIHDPEQPQQPRIYGWDGQRFLGDS